MQVYVAPVQSFVSTSPQPLHGGRNGLHRAAEVVRAWHGKCCWCPRHRHADIKQHGPRGIAEPADATDQLIVKISPLPSSKKVSTRSKVILALTFPVLDLRFTFTFFTANFKYVAFFESCFEGRYYLVFMHIWLVHERRCKIFLLYIKYILYSVVIRGTLSICLIFLYNATFLC